jgi:hypothetical protein
MKITAACAAMLVGTYVCYGAHSYRIFAPQRSAGLCQERT